jgi:O-antigen/teichoic acid export membrane protein
MLQEISLNYNTDKVVPLPLRTNFIWTFFGNGIFAACRWGLLVILAKLGSAEIVGQLSLGIAICTPIMTFMDLNLRGVMVTDAKGIYTFGDYVGLRSITTCLALFLIGLVIILSGYSLETRAIVLFVGLERACWSLSDIIYGYFQQYGRMDYISISMISKNILSLCLASSIFYFGGGIVWGTLGLVAGSACTLFSYDLLTALGMRKSLFPKKTASPFQEIIGRILIIRREISRIRALIWFALPLGLVMLMHSLSTNIPRYFIERYLGARELGIFSAIMAPTLAGGVIVSALGQSASRHLAEYYAFGNIRSYRILLLKLLGIGFLLGSAGMVAAWIWGKQVLTILYRPEYAAYPDVFMVIMVFVGIGFPGSFVGFGLTSAQYFRIQIILATCVAAITAVGSIWLIPRLGLMGSAISLVFANLFYLLAGLIVVSVATLKRSKMGM